MKSLSPYFFRSLITFSLVLLFNSFLISRPKQAFSSTVLQGKRESSCNMYPIFGFLILNFIFPLDSFKIFASIVRIVDFPQPEGPTIEINSFFLTLKLMSFKANISPVSL